MSKPIEIRLSDAQCAALAAEAEAAGLKFFDHCRAKLLANVTLPAEKPQRAVSDHGRPPVERETRVMPPAPAAAPPPDRIDRLEALMLQMAETVANLAQPQAHAPDQVQDEYDPNVDIDDVVNASLGEAERQGLTVVDRGAAPVAAGGVRHVGTMPPRPFSPATQPRHLQGLGG